MDQNTLRSVQAPLKETYRTDPAAAVVTLSAFGDLGADQSCSVQTGQALVAAGLHPATGGDGSFACSGDMLLQALTMMAVATSLGLQVAGTVHADGDLDFRGTLGVDREAPVGFSAIRLSFDLRTDATDDEVATLLQLTERYCVVFQTLRTPPTLDASMA